MYSGEVPKLWTETIAAHRREVQDAVLETTAALVAEHGLRAVTMSQIAEQTGIGRATLYKYFPDIEAILVAWHDRQIAAHLAQLAEVADRTEEPARRLEAVLEAYAHITHRTQTHHDTELGAFLHRYEQLDSAQRRLHELVTRLLTDGAAAGVVRDDVPPEELAGYCLHALAAARTLRSRAAVRRLVGLILAGLRCRE